MSAALATFPAETKWTVISGSMQGSVRLMNMPTFTIGRSPECQFIVVNDPKCSRRHADVTWTEQGYEIVSLNDNNQVQVNGREVNRAILSDNDVVTVGQTEVQFNLTTASPVSPPRHKTEIRLVTPGDAIPSNITGASRSYSTSASQTRRTPPKKKTNPMMLVVYVVVALLVLLLFATPSAKKKAELALRNEQQIQADIDTANKLNEAAQKTPNRRIDQSLTARQAQENFVRGFRDYRKGQFERSLDSFQACLALDPGHTLCNRYIRLAQRRFDELVQSNIVLGRKYRDQNQFEACRAAFRNVMVMVKDPTSAIYREAKANYEACNSLMEDRF